MLFFAYYAFLNTFDQSKEYSQIISGLACASENVDDLVCDHVLDRLSCGFEILSGIEVLRVLREIFPDVSGHGQTNIGIDVDLADGKLCCVAKLILGDTDRIGHVAAICVHHLDKLLRNGGRSV